jgi:hypothetical protein
MARTKFVVKPGKSAKPMESASTSKLPAKFTKELPKSKNAPPSPRRRSGTAKLPDPTELTLRETDVICGRGSGVASWQGNVEFRYICWKVKDIYTQAHRADKALIAQQIMNQIGELNPPGRFVKLVEGTEVVDGRYANTAVRA